MQIENENKQNALMSERKGLRKRSEWLQKQVSTMKKMKKREKKALSQQSQQRKQNKLMIEDEKQLWTKTIHFCREEVAPFTPTTSTERVCDVAGLEPRG
jgi:hypothetical protein